MGKLIEESFKSGILVATEGCLPAHSAHASASPAQLQSHRRPFTEAKELVGGFALIKVKSRRSHRLHQKIMYLQATAKSNSARSTTTPPSRNKSNPNRAAK